MSAALPCPRTCYTHTLWRLQASIIVPAAYLLGSFPTGYVLMRVFRRQDMRALGSGNIGATNVLRSGGKALGAATLCWTRSRARRRLAWAAWSRC